MLSVFGYATALFVEEARGENPEKEKLQRMCTRTLTTFQLEGRIRKET